MVLQTSEISIGPPPDTSKKKESAPEPITVEHPSTLAPFPNWKKDLRDAVRLDLRSFARAAGAPSWYFDSWFDQNADNLMNWASQFVLTPDIQQAVRESTTFESSMIERAPVGVNAMHPTADSVPDLSGLLDPFSPDGMGQLRNISANWLTQYVPGFGDFINNTSFSGGGGGGSRKPTAAEIRAQFDLDHLTRIAQETGRQYLVEDLDDPRAIAQAYVDKVVATGAEQDINYETFLINRIKKTDRWAQIYRNKPEGVNELNYIQPFAQSAMQALGGNRGQGISKVVGEGAALGGSAQSFSARLAKEDVVKNSSGFIAGLEKTMSSVSNILR